MGNDTSNNVTYDEKNIQRESEDKNLQILENKVSLKGNPNGIYLSIWLRSLSNILPVFAEVHKISCRGEIASEILVSIIAEKTLCHINTMYKICKHLDPIQLSISDDCMRDVIKRYPQMAPVITQMYPDETDKCLRMKHSDMFYPKNYLKRNMSFSKKYIRQIYSEMWYYVVTNYFLIMRTCGHDGAFYIKIGDNVSMRFSQWIKSVELHDNYLD